MTDNRKVIASQAEVPDSMPMELIPHTTPAELEEYKAASVRFWSAAQCRQRRILELQRLVLQAEEKAEEQRTGRMLFNFKKV